MAELIFLETTESTNKALEECIRKGRAEHGLAVATFRQTKGRGQTGNKWVSEPDSNLALSICLKPDFLPARNQFMLLKTAALAVRHCLEEYTDGISIKWPNDIYLNDGKLCGILMENRLNNNLVDYSIVGIGINVNQTKFPASLPNPVSLKQATNKTFDLTEIAERLHREILKSFDGWNIDNHLETDRFYINHLYRRDGFHRYSDQQGEFSARILGVAALGNLILEKEDGEVREYAFKEVTFVL